MFDERPTVRMRPMGARLTIPGVARESRPHVGPLHPILESIYLVHQPIVSWSKRRVIATESLLRRTPPGPTGAMEVIKTVEKLGRRLDLGRVVRDEVALTIGLMPPDQSVYVNVYPEDLLDELESPLLGDVASRIVLELGEREAFADASAKECLAELRRRGYRIALDDVGAGYSGLRWLVDFEPDVVKVDMGLVRGIESSYPRRKLVRSLIEVSADMRATVIAEGVETVAERDTLVELGCDLFQGYLFAKPAWPCPEVKF